MSIDFIEYILAGKVLFDYTNLFLPNDYKENGKIICMYFKDKYGQSLVYIKKEMRQEISF